MPMLRTITINKAIEAAGGKERLVKERDYAYFCEGDAAKWPRTMVTVYRLNSFPLERWVQIWREYRQEWLDEQN